MCKDGSEVYPLGTFKSSECVRINTNHPEKYDHTPLWEYLNTSGHGTSTGEKCAPGKLKNRAAMEVCLDWWKDNAPPRSDSDWKPLFTSDIVQSPRFAGIPILDKDPGGGFSSYLITEFQPIYLETTYLGCNGVTCAIVHSPGEGAETSPPPACSSPITASDWSCGWPGNGNKIFEAMTAFVLELDMLPDDISEKFPYRDGTIVYNLYK